MPRCTGGGAERDRASTGMTLAMLAASMLILTIAIFLIGVAGSFLPIVPGTLVVWFGVLVHKLAMGDQSVSWGFFVAATALALGAQVLDFACSYWGARRFGASWQGAAGALVGGVLGLAFFNLPGLILGPIAGAVLVELIKDRNWRRARRAGVGTLVGGIAAFVLKFSISCGIIAGFFWALPA